jgi:predicted nucleotidyltransferase
MPVRSLGTAVLVWPDATKVLAAARRWADDLRRADESVAAVGLFGSYAKGDWGVGSDLDLVVIVSDSRLPFERRAVRFDTIGLPVPADVLVYTSAEWAVLTTRPRPVNWLSGSTP